MPNTYTQLHIHFVFAVKYRASAIRPSWKHTLYKYITGITQKNEHKMLAINGVSDHVHILIGVRPSQSISDLMQDIKGSSSKWINEQKLTPNKFEWQGGYGAFACSKSDVNRVIDYIKNQEEHHAEITFRDEYLDFLRTLELDFDERYIFHEML
ncbi:MAG: IS200/IS605 family transposase [Bacteroidota bacterium]